MNRVSIMLLAAISCAFVSCELDEADVYSEQEILEGNKALATVVEVAFAENDKSKIETSDDDVYYYSVGDRSEADAFVSSVTCGEYSDDSPTYVLPAGFGVVDVHSLDENSNQYYYYVDFDVVGYSGIRYILVCAESDSLTNL